MSDLFGNHIVGFPTRRLIYGQFFTLDGSQASQVHEIACKRACLTFGLPEVKTKLKRGMLVWSQNDNAILLVELFGPHSEKTGFVLLRKQRHSSAVH